MEVQQQCGVCDAVAVREELDDEVQEVHHDHAGSHRDRTLEQTGATATRQETVETPGVSRITVCVSVSFP